MIVVVPPAAVGVDATVPVHTIREALTVSTD